MVRQFGEDKDEPGLRIDVVQLAAVDERIDCRGATAALIRSSKCPIASSDCYTTQGTFRGIVRQTNAPVIKEAREPFPMIQAVTDGFCDQGLAGDCMVGVTTVVFERGVGVVIVVTLPLPWMACLRVYALVV